MTALATFPSIHTPVFGPNITRSWGKLSCLQCYTYPAFQIFELLGIKQPSNVQIWANLTHQSWPKFDNVLMHKDVIPSKSTNLNPHPSSISLFLGDVFILSLFSLMPWHKPRTARPVDWGPFPPEACGREGKLPLAAGEHPAEQRARVAKKSHGTDFCALLSPWYMWVMLPTVRCPSSIISGSHSWGQTVALLLPIEPLTSQLKPSNGRLFVLWHQRYGHKTARKQPR